MFPAGCGDGCLGELKDEVMSGAESSEAELEGREQVVFFDVRLKSGRNDSFEYFA